MAVYGTNIHKYALVLRGYKRIKFLDFNETIELMINIWANMNKQSWTDNYGQNLFLLEYKHKINYTCANVHKQNH